MRVTLATNTFVEGRFVREGEVLDLADEQAQALIEQGVATEGGSESNAPLVATPPALESPEGNEPPALESLTPPAPEATPAPAPQQIPVTEVTEPPVAPTVPAPQVQTQPEQPTEQSQPSADEISDTLNSIQ
jgi:hypothetical protein